MGRNFKYSSAAYGAKSDTGVYCTSLVRDVLYMYLLQMTDEGFIADAWENHFERSSDVLDPTCYDENSSSVANGNNDKDTDILNSTNLGGIIVFHLVCVHVALMVTLVQFFSRKKTKKPSLLRQSTRTS